MIEIAYFLLGAVFGISIGAFIAVFGMIHWAMTSGDMDYEDFERGEL